jgi:TetR/AcrR family transcriptional regulator
MAKSTRATVATGGNGRVAKKAAKPPKAPKAPKAPKVMKATARSAKTSAGAAAPAARNGADAASRREQRRLLQQDLSRAQLLDAAEEVFGAKGFHETTLKEIADLAEFSVGSVYSFFENKDDLFLNVFLRRGAEFLPGMLAVAEGAGTPLETLHALADYEVEFFRAHPHFGRLFLRSASTVVPVPDILESNELGGNFEVAMQTQADVFRKGQKSGVFRTGDPVVLARMFSGLVSSYQSLDPAVVADEPGAAERMSIAELHAIIDGAFCR